MRPDVAAGREPRMCDAKTCDAITPVKKDKAEMKHKVLERATETVFKLCEKVEAGTASSDELSALVDLIRTVAY